MPDAEELNPHNLLSHLTHTQSIHPVIALLWEADVRLPWFSCVRGRGIARRDRGAQYCRQDTGGWLGGRKVLRCKGVRMQLSEGTSVFMCVRVRVW